MKVVIWPNRDQIEDITFITREVLPQLGNFLDYKTNVIAEDTPFEGYDQLVSRDNFNDFESFGNEPVATVDSLGLVPIYCNAAISPRGTRPPARFIEYNEIENRQLPEG